MHAKPGSLKSVYGFLFACYKVAVMLSKLHVFNLAIFEISQATNKSWIQYYVQRRYVLLNSVGKISHFLVLHMFIVFTCHIGLHTY